MKIEQNSGYSFVELYVGMAKMVAWWHERVLGFEIAGKRERKGLHGMEVSYWLRNGKANLIITSAMDPAAHDVVSFVDRHGNSIKRFGLVVESIESTWSFLQEEKAIFSGRGIEHETCEGESARFIRCKLFDDNEIMFVERARMAGPLPGFVPIQNSDSSADGLVTTIDHLASVVCVNESDFWKDYLCRILTLEHAQTIGEEFFQSLSSGMKMHALHSSEININKVIVEPLVEKPKSSQVDIFLEHNYGTGIQHVAFEVDDLIQVVREYRGRGVKFTPIPDRYYQNLEEDFPELPVDKMRENQILCEKDGDKLLLQVFIEPIGDRPTLFYEFIQRVNDYDGFGAGNVRQLFKSLEIQLDGES